MGMARGLLQMVKYSNEEELKKTLELGKKYPFKITLFEPKDHRMTLSYKTK